MCVCVSAVVGTSVVITMGINIISPHFQFVLHMITSCCKHSKVGFAMFVTQQQADKVSAAWVGRVRCL